MELAALGLALVALLVAAVALARAGAAAASQRQAARDLAERLTDLEQRQQQETQTTRRLLAQLAEGVTLDQGMIMDGQLWRDVSPHEALDLVAAGSVRLIDVRTQEETAGGVIQGAILLPIDELEQRFQEIPADGRATLIYCAAGGRSAAACGFLAEQGYRNLMNLAGGISSWPGEVQRPST